MQLTTQLQRVSRLRRGATPSTPRYVFDTPAALTLKQELPRMSDMKLRRLNIFYGDFEETSLAVTGYRTKIAPLFSQYLSRHTQ